MLFTKPNTGSSHKRLGDADVAFGRRFEEQSSIGIGKLLSLLSSDSPFLIQITLVPDENNILVHARRGVSLNEKFPSRNVCKRSLLKK
jgi:hypothetical protein